MKEIKKETVFMHGVILLLILVNPLVTYFVVDYKIDNISTEVIRKQLLIEYDKVGGMENYKKVTDITREQAITWLAQYDAQNKGQVNTQTIDTNQNNAQPTSKSIAPELASSIISGSKHILGKSDANITVIEYSDLECPFCKKSFQSGVKDRLLQAYPENINVVFKQFPLKMHPGAQMQAEAALCVGELAGTEVYYKFITSIFKNSKQNGNSFTVSSITDLATPLGVESSALSTCISSGKFKDEVQKQMDEGVNIFGVSSTPSSVVIDNETGDWEILTGAHSYENFKQVVDYFLQK